MADQIPLVTVDAESAGNRWYCAGVTISVDLNHNTIRLWIDAINTECDTPITDDMPHWLLQEDVSFITTIPRFCAREKNLDGVVWGEFSVVPYSSLTEDELFDELAKLTDTTSTADQ